MLKRANLFHTIENLLLNKKSCNNMFLALLIKYSVSLYACVDLGGQNIRVSYNEPSGAISMAANRKGKTLTPNAAAIGLKEYDNKHLNIQNISNLNLKIGDEAVKFIKNHPESGSSYIGRIIGRESTEEYPIPNIAKPEEMLGMVLSDIVQSRSLAGLEGISCVIPAYYTYEQRTKVMEGFHSTGVQFVGLLDDHMAISQYYSFKFKDRFKDTNRTVLFVDIGAHHATSYRIDFYSNATGLHANQTSYEWSENTGTYSFARAIADDKDISFNKAMKYLMRTEDDLSELLSIEIEELKRIVRLSLADDDVDEVQIYGGGSKLRFVREAVEEAAGMDPLRELPAFDVTALGGGMYTLHVAKFDEITFDIVHPYRASIYTSYVTCDEAAADYCVRSQNCTEIVILDNVMCKNVYINADETELPKGILNPTLAIYDLKNATKMQKEIPEDVFSAIFLMFPPMPIITSINWCITATLNCKPVVFELHRQRLTEYDETASFVRRVRLADKNRRDLISAKFKFDSISATASEKNLLELISIISDNQDTIHNSYNLTEVQKIIEDIEVKAKELNIDL